MSYGAMTYLIGKNEVWSKAAIRFLGLDLTSLDMDLEELDDKSTPLVLRAMKTLH